MSDSKKSAFSLKKMKKVKKETKPMEITVETHNTNSKSNPNPNPNPIPSANGLTVNHQQSNGSVKPLPVVAGGLDTELILTGTYLKEISQNWHMEHFNCWSCDQSLIGAKYVVREEKPFCLTCFEQQHSNVCEECQKPIGVESKDLSYKDRHWHELCFACSKCKESLVDKPFGSKSDRIFCGPCYDEMFATKCDKCGEVFRAGQRKLEYKGKQWHDECFTCKKCLGPIGTKSFVPKEDDVFCSDCYETVFATRCVKCSEVITGNGVEYRHEPWHKHCFVCEQCRCELSSVPFIVRDDLPYCKQCHTDKFAHRCETCQKPITGSTGTKFITYESRHWHVECFQCASCHTALEGRGFIKDGPDVLCGECAKERLASEMATPATTAATTTTTTSG